MKLEYYVLWHDFNKDRILCYNIFNSSFTEDVKKLLDNFTTYSEFKEKLDNELMYHYAHKVEYEIMIGGVVSKHDNIYKFNIYDQVHPNLDMLARYIIEQYNNRKYAKKRIEI